jgi:hypothetical protein
MGEGAGVSLDIANMAATGWAIIKDNSPQSSAKTSFCQAIPKAVPFNKMSGWKSYSGNFVLSYHDLLTREFCHAEMVLDFDYGGQIDGEKGVYVTNFNVWCRDLDMGYFWHIDLDASVSGAAFNAGSKTEPVGAIPLLVSWHLHSFADDFSKSVKITARGDGKYTWQ